MTANLSGMKVLIYCIGGGWFAGKVALEALGFDVEEYYASEVDRDAVTVTQCRHYGKVQQVGDVCQLTSDKVCSMSKLVSK